MKKAVVAVFIVSILKVYSANAYVCGLGLCLTSTPGVPVILGDNRVKIYPLGASRSGTGKHIHVNFCEDVGIPWDSAHAAEIMQTCDLQVSKDAGTHQETTTSQIDLSISHANALDLDINNIYFDGGVANTFTLTLQFSNLANARRFELLFKNGNWGQLYFRIRRDEAATNTVGIADLLVRK